MKELSLNSEVIVKLTDYGKEILKSQGILNTIRIDENGYADFQMWELMHYFGSHMFIGDTKLPFEQNSIIIPDENLVEFRKGKTL